MVGSHVGQTRLTNDFVGELLAAVALLQSEQWLEKQMKQISIVTIDQNDSVLRCPVRVLGCDDKHVCGHCSKNISPIILKRIFGVCFGLSEHI